MVRLDLRYAPLIPLSLGGLLLRLHEAPLPKVPRGLSDVVLILSKHVELVEGLLNEKFAV